MWKKLLPLLLTLLFLACCAAAEAPRTLVITDTMEFYSGPGGQYLQSAFHNTPPLPGETADVLGRVSGTDGQDWLLVRFTGHWFDQAYDVWYYLPVAMAPEHADAPLLTFLNEPNALAVESARVYADPDGRNYDGYITPTEDGVTVLALEDSSAYIEAVNPFGIPRRGFVSVRDLAHIPGASALQEAPDGTATRILVSDLPLAYRPVRAWTEVLALEDGSLVLHYDTIPTDAPWGEALAIVSPDGQLAANVLHRTHDGMEESTIEFLLTSLEGFRICRYASNDLTPLQETHYNLAGEAVRTDLRRYAGIEPRPRMSTASFTLALGADDGSPTLPLRITAASGEVTQISIRPDDQLYSVTECAGLLLVPVCGEGGVQLLVFGQQAQLMTQLLLPGQLHANPLQAVPMADGRIALLFSDGLELWQGFCLDPVTGTLTAISSLSVPYNRTVSLLAANDRQMLLAISGVSTQLILWDGQAQQLAATIPGALCHACSDGQTATLLLLENGQMRLERWQLRLP